MKFYINDYKGKYAMHCKTEEEAKDFCNYLHSIGKKWIGGGKYNEDSFYCYYQERSVYYFNRDQYGYIQEAKDKHYTILEWEDFMNKEFTKGNLKTGDVVKYKCGEVGIVNRNFEMIIGTDGWIDLNTISEDLTDKLNNNYDIIAVRRPTAQCHCQFKAFEQEWGTLVYEREEVEEMTLAEVCKLLGKNIKIVK